MKKETKESEYTTLKKSYLVQGNQFWAKLLMHNYSGHVTVHLKDEHGNPLPDTGYLRYRVEPGTGLDLAQIDLAVLHQLDHHVERVKGWPKVRERMEEEGWHQA
jgi:hypothetical protein